MSSLVEDFVQSLQSGAPLPTQYIQSFTTLTRAIGSLEDIAPPPNAGAYAGSGYVTQNLGTLKNALMAWPNSVSPACRNTPSVIVNWDPALQANIALLQQWAASTREPGTQPGGRQRDPADPRHPGQQQKRNRCHGDRPSDTGAGNRDEWQPGAGDLPARRDGHIQSVPANSQPGCPKGRRRTQDNRQSGRGELSEWTDRYGANFGGGCTILAPILQHARNEFGAAAPAVQYILGIWSGLQKNLSNSTAIARLVQQKPESIS